MWLSKLKFGGVLRLRSCRGDGELMTTDDPRFKLGLALLEEKYRYSNATLVLAAWLLSSDLAFRSASYGRARSFVIWRCDFWQ
jgi:hypothetical protein